MKKLCGLFLLFLLVGCASSRDAEYYRVYDATHQVLSRNNMLVKESQYREDTLIAVSKVHGDFLNKTRVKVVARVVEDQHGTWEPRIRVINQWDNSDVRTWGHPDYHDNSQWINLSANSAMEARLYNEIQEQMGEYNPYEGKGFRPVYHENNAQAVHLAPYDQ